MQQELWTKETQGNEQEEIAETGRKIYRLKKKKNRMVI